MRHLRHPHLAQARQASAEEGVQEGRAGGRQLPPEARIDPERGSHRTVRTDDDEFLDQTCGAGQSPLTHESRVSRVVGL